MRLHVGLHLLQGMGLGEGIGVLPLRQQDDLDVQALGQGQIGPFERGVDAGAVAVVHDSQGVRELVDQPDLLDGQRGAAGGHDIAYAQLGHHHHVHVALDQDAAALPRNLRFREIDAQQVAALGIDLRFRRIDIFRRIVGVQGASAEGDHTPADRMDGEHHPLAEFVREAAVLTLHDQAGRQQILRLITGGPRRIDERRLAGRRPAQAPLRDRRVLEAPVAVIGIAYVAAFAAFQLLCEEFGREFGGQQYALAALPARDLLGRFLLFLDLDVIFMRQIAQSLGIGEFLVLHQEADRRAGLAAAEAFENALGRRDVEGGGFLVVKGAAGHETGPAALQRHEITDHFFDAGGVQNLVDCLLRNHKETKLVIKKQSRKGI